MILKSLKLHGFKTFYDKTLLSFDKGITTVVGPNGSGKSNISDAIRWVMGEQSAKVLRCGKMEDVIFNGTPTKKALGFAEVTLTIDDPENKLHQDTKEIAITRRYYRSGESEYLINERNVRLKDIHEMFMDTGLGKDGYSVIGQGKIDSIVASKSEDRREVFEEAAGISRFRYRKADAENRLSSAKENLLRLLDILKDLEDRVGPLREQAEKAEKYVILANDKKSLEIGLWVSTLDKSSKTLSSHEEKLSIARAQYDSIEDEILEINNKTENSFKKSSECVAQIDELRRSISTVDEKISEMQRDISVHENDELHNNENIQRCENEIREASESTSTLDAKVEEKRSEIKFFQLSINEKQRTLDEKTDKLINLQKQMTDASEAMKSMTSNLSSMSVELSSAKVNLLTSTSSISDMENRIASIESELGTINLRIVDFDKSLHEYSQMDSDMKMEIQKNENIISGYEMKLDSKRKKFDELKKKADVITLDCEDKIRRVRLLEELERNMEGFAQSVKAVMKESSKGMLSGIHGPISRIITVPDKYALAIGTALGAAVQNVIVDSEQDAKKAIFFLKQRNIGRATFMPMSTMTGTEVSSESFEKCSGFIGVASRLCSVKDEYLGILRYVLGRIIVASDIDSAIAIAKKNSYRFRVVTLDGQMINAGGSLTGGSQVKGSSIISRAGEIKTLKREYDELQSRAKEARKLSTQTENEISELDAKVLGYRADLMRSKDECSNISKELHRVSFELESTKKLKLSRENEKKSCCEKLKEFLSIKEKSENQISALQRDISTLEEKIKSESGSHDILSSDREKLSDEIQNIKLDIFSMNKDIATCELEIKSTLELKVSSFDKASSLREQIDQINIKNDSIRETILNLKKNIANLKGEKESCDNEIKNLAQKRMDFEKIVTELRKSEREKTNERELISKDLTKLEERKNNLQKEYDNIIAKLWDEYELTRSEACKQCTKVEDISKSQKELQEIKNKIKALGNVNVGAIEEYKEVNERYEFMSEQVADVEKSRDELCKLIRDLTTQMEEMFLMKFNIINENFEQSFRDLFGGGHAKIEFTDPSSVLTSGIEIKVSPPGKIVNRLEALSGGERALVAIALYFAIMQVNPPPFCVLDEIEAALDEVNVVRFASYLRKINDNTQFIAISHRRGTMEEADVLYGVTMQDEGISKLLKMNAKI